MITFQVIGNDLALSLAVQARQLELNVMTPVMMHNILQSIQLLARANKLSSSVQKEMR
jgi:aspartate ammonia-lyase